MLGDSVNLAARLESQTKIYGFPIIAGAQTALAAKDDVAILEIDFVIVKGKTEPESVYAIVGRKEIEDTVEFSSMRTQVTELRECYRGLDWEGALRLIERTHQRDGAGRLEMLFELYRERIEAFRSNPPPGDWNGAYQLMEK